jgi:hypothetical protein
MENSQVNLLKMNFLEKRIRLCACLSLLLTLLVVVITGMLASKGMPQSDLDYLKFASQPDVWYKAYYINAMMLTLLIIVLFTLLFSYLSEINKTSALLGMVFIPVYGAINLVCYSIQITVVPSIAAHALSTSASTSGDVWFAAQFIMTNTHSVVGFIYGLAYSMLGIPSVIFGYMLMRNTKKLSGILLIIHGLLYFIGFTGFLMQNAALSAGINLGAIVFLINLIAIIYDFRNPVKK